MDLRNPALTRPLQPLKKLCILRAWGVMVASQMRSSLRYRAKSRLLLPRAKRWIVIAAWSMSAARMRLIPLALCAPHRVLGDSTTSPPPPPPPPHTEDTAHSQQQQEQQQVPLLPTPNVPAYPLTSSHPIYGAQQQQQQHFGGPGPTSPTNLGSPSSYAHHPGSRVSGPPHPQPHPHGHPHAPHLHRRGGKEWIPVPRSVAREADGYPVLNLAKEHEFPSPALRKYTARFEVGIENEREFTVARRIIGNKGSHMRAVWEMTKAKLRLRGRGSGYYEGSQQTECPEPLHLCISCRTYDGYVLAMRMVADLLLRIHDDYREWCAIQGRPVPNLQLRYREHPLDRRSSNINASKKADNNRERQPHAPAPSVSVSVTSPSGASASPWCNPDHFGGLMSSYLQRGESTEGGEATRPYTHHNEIGFPLHMHSTDDRTPYNRR
mmetsp:Transcript_35301/g.87685  ORF Transcript_35301/g.87685 Transcript_35301/m.87685 type:complete len:436 (-) Transcript_35301:11-1318(-)